MRRVISVFLALVLVAGAAFAQKKDDKNGWREKLRAEQVAFLTTELGLTESEAQAFWPVYNEVQQQRREAYELTFKAYKELSDNTDAKETETLLNAYLQAKEASDAFETKAIARYKGVLPVEKVAKLVLAEEKFRHQQIGKLGKGDQQGGPQGGPRGGRPFPQMNEPSFK